MKKIYRRLVIVSVVMVFLLVSGLAFAQTKKATPSPKPAPTDNPEVNVSSIGLLDINKVFEAHPNTAKIVELEKKINEEFQKRQQELTEKGKGKTKEEVQKLEEEMNAEWAPIRDEMLKNRQALLDERYGDIIAVVKKVAENMKLTLVIRSELRIPVSQKELLEMPLVFYGGLDITDKVIEELKNLVASKTNQ
ncbi:MAG: OmpH family outer membrane protein [Candidatus Atribacteria bacterium]|nr:OmpH family outer membrane protein [Candidatus Atribacteria bacterium]